MVDSSKNAGSEDPVVDVVLAGFAVVSSKNPVAEAVEAGAINSSAAPFTCPTTGVSLIRSVIPNVPFLIPFDLSSASALILACSLAFAHRSVTVDFSFRNVSMCEGFSGSPVFPGGGGTGAGIGIPRRDLMAGIRRTLAWSRENPLVNVQ